MTSFHDWRRARRERRGDQRRLPPGLRRDVATIRREDLGHDAVTAVLYDVETLAAARGEVLTIHSSGAEPWSYVPPSVERDVLQLLERRKLYRHHVRAEVRSTLRLAHKTKVDPGAALVTLPASLGPTPSVEDGILEVSSSLGLGTASALEAEPEGWNHWVATQLVHGDSEYAEESLGLLSEQQAHRVFVLGALAGGLARAVTTLDTSHFRITEFDWVLDSPSALSCVDCRSFPDSSHVFDTAVAVFPSCSTSNAANQRGIYGRSDFDPARLGPRRWVKRVLGYLGLVNARLRDGAILYVLLPLGVRGNRGYEDGPSLEAAILPRLSECGFAIVYTIPTTEREPVAQPFVGRARPKKLTLVLQKTHAVEGL